VKMLFAAFIALSSSAFGQTCDPQGATYAACIEEAANAGQPPCLSCQVAEAVAPECNAKYDRLFRDGTVNTTIAWGYTDSNGSAEDNVWGEYWNSQIVDRLTGPCPASFQMYSPEQHGEDSEAIAGRQEATGCGGPVTFRQSCGFSRGDDPEIFTKTIVRNGRSIKLNIRVLQSALSASDSVNRSSRVEFIKKRICATTPATQVNSCVTQNTPPQVSSAQLLQSCRAGDEQLYQICRSDYVRRAWRSSIENGDEIVMYNGHARKGGGPSFDPPKVRSDGHVDYAWYESVREGHNQEAKSFETAVARGNPPVIYASHSCDSQKHFIRNGRFPEVSPTTAIVGSTRTSYSDETVGSTLATLDSAFSGSCDINTRIQSAACGFGINNF
jgi:hypothetical protein